MLLGDTNSRVHGFVHDDIFEGRVHFGDGNEFHIESTKQYNHLDPTKFHSVIYNVRDIVHPKQHVCGGIMASSQEHMNRTVWKDLRGVINDKNVVFYISHLMTNHCINSVFNV